MALAIKITNVMMVIPIKLRRYLMLKLARLLYLVRKDASISILYGWFIIIAIQLLTIIFGPILRSYVGTYLRKNSYIALTIIIIAILIIIYSLVSLIWGSLIGPFEKVDRLFILLLIVFSPGLIILFMGASYAKKLLNVFVFFVIIDSYLSYKIISILRKMVIDKKKIRPVIIIISLIVLYYFTKDSTILRNIVSMLSK